MSNSNIYLEIKNQLEFESLVKTQLRLNWNLELDLIKIKLKLKKSNSQNPFYNQKNTMIKKPR